MPRLPNPAMYSDLAVDPPYIHMARSEERDLTFAAGETAASVSVTLRTYEVDTVIAGPVAAGGAASGPIASVALLANVATVRLTGATLALDAVYRVRVTFGTSGGEEWTRELLVEVVG